MAIVHTNSSKLKMPKNMCAPAASAAQTMLKDLYDCSMKTMTPGKVVDSTKIVNQFSMGKKAKNTLAAELVKSLLGKLGCSKQKSSNNKQIKKKTVQKRNLQDFSDKRIHGGRWRGIPNWRETGTSRKNGGYRRRLQKRNLQDFSDKRIHGGRWRGIPNWRETGTSRKNGGYRRRLSMEKIREVMSKAIHKNQKKTAKKVEDKANKAKRGLRKGTKVLKKNFNKFAKEAENFAQQYGGTIKQVACGKLGPKCTSACDLAVKKMAKVAKK